MDLEEPRAWIGAARTVVVFSGAGVSAESGVPTFRGEQGLWRSYRAEDLATPAAFRRDPRLVWEWYAWRRGLVAACAPNAAHQAIAEAQLMRSGVHVVTQNVDGLHERALRARGGVPGLERSILALHGSIAHSRCSTCSYRELDEHPVDASALDRLPRCPRCGALLRPDVVWFGERLDARTLDHSFDLAAGADVCLVVGTSGLVEPAASVPRITAGAGGRVLVLGPEETALDGLADRVLRGRATELVPALFG